MGEYPEHSWKTKFFVVVGTFLLGIGLFIVNLFESIYLIIFMIFILLIGGCFLVIAIFSEPLYKKPNKNKLKDEEVF